ncbi:MAG: type II secretion system protein GspF [Desulfobacterales bacterium]|nr:MAG: type II secretion system protein GspF [Desulfobacterales bacterium]
MPVFEYSALNARGKTISGIVDAESLSAARQKLRTGRVYPVSIRESRRQAVRCGGWRESLFRSLARVKPVEISLMTRQLATLVGAGFPLVTAVDTLIPQTRSPAFQKVLAQVKDAVVEGASFAAALSPYPGIFSPLFTNMVRAGESSGTLEIVLDRLADITEKQQKLKNRIRQALAYPVLMAVIGMAVLFFLITYIVPSIAVIFEDMGQTLPAVTRFLIALGGFFADWWWLILLFLAALPLGIRLFRRTEKGRDVWDRATLSAPGFGSLVRRLAVARFARTLGSLLANGVSLLAALEIVENIVGNVHLAAAVRKSADDVGRGQALGASLGESDLFPGLAVQMIQVGEKSGELEIMLEKVAEVYESEVESAVMSLTSLLEPVMILCMAVVVGFIVLSICLPIFEMNQLVR